MSKRIAKKRTRRRHFIKMWRIYRDQTQEYLAERLETTAASISRIETGKQPYTQDVLEAFADELRCEPADLLSRNPFEPQLPIEILARLRSKQNARVVDALKVLLGKDQE